uniref:Uncharacterized protein n=2 Tax=Parascaris univalens TaxID=6257 RepID=A0A915A1B8_PARUN
FSIWFLMLDGWRLSAAFLGSVWTVLVGAMDRGAPSKSKGNQRTRSSSGGTQERARGNLSISKLRFAKLRQRIPKSSELEERTVFEKVDAKFCPARSKAKKKKSALKWKDAENNFSMSIGKGSSSSKSVTTSTSETKSSKSSISNRKLHSSKSKKATSEKSNKAAKPSRRMPKEIIRQRKHMLEVTGSSAERGVDEKTGGTMRQAASASKGNKSESYQHQKMREQSTITDDGGTDYEEESSSDSGRSTTFLETKKGSSITATKLPLTEEPSIYIDSAMRKQAIKTAGAAKTEGRKISVREEKQGHKISIKEEKKEYEGEHLNRELLLMKSNEEAGIRKAEGIAKKYKRLRSVGESVMQNENSSDRKVKSGEGHRPTRAHMSGIGKEKKSGMEKAPPPTERCEEEQQRAKNLLEEDNKHGCKLKEDVACIKVDKNVIRDAEQDKTVPSTSSENGVIRKKEKKKHAEKPSFQELQAIHAREEQGSDILGGERSHKMLRDKCAVENTQESPPAKSQPEGRSTATPSR